MHEALLVLFLLLVAHSLADYPLQGDFLAEGKDRHNIVGERIWPWALSSHALIHGGMVYAVLYEFSPADTELCLHLGMLEVAAHAVIDFGKCERWWNYHQDQALHIGCKVAWVALFMLVA